MRSVTGVPARRHLRGRAAAAARRGARACWPVLSCALRTRWSRSLNVVEFLHSLSADSVEILGAEAAGVMLADQRGGLRLIASSEERMRILELFEIQGAQGPCLDAFGSGPTVQATAAEGSSRWPLFAPRASQAGFCVMCAVPLQVRRT